ncbi:polysaccharide pyruvyl transferase family protein [Nitratireductor sp. GZWM139]|uniref:polysaccharide pyruvyl transferase family protein n=1 Tax=Nitratireductor sp. GZWM139 TaxID=2950541 RepID=UPI0024BE64FB|nr:polysaccharide pyruvyl transferase family protein [Nitratireductor sp. GZWM139]MDJ1465804.1 polysaccharide pyruvyl transferase family protein [Nitratireductor sp. GZWM139]
MSKTALLYGFLGSNVGDVAVTRGAIETIRALGMKGPMTVVAPKLNNRARDTWTKDVWRHYPYLDLVEWDFKNIPQERPVTVDDIDDIATASLLISLKINDADTFVYSGGEHLFSYGKSGDDWNLLLRLAPFFAAASMGKQVRLLPSTLGPFNTPLSDVLAKRFLSLLPDIPVRDTHSLETVANLGFQGRFCLDPAFFINISDLLSCDKQPIANLIMRLDRYGLRVGEAQSLEYAQYLVSNGYGNSRSYNIHRDVAKTLADKGFQINVIIQTMADEAPSLSLYRELSQEPNIRATLSKPTSIEAFIRELSKGRVTVTSRFHGAIFSLLSDRPATAIFFKDHGNKMPGLFEGLGWSHLCFDGDKKTANQIAEAAIARPGSGDLRTKLDKYRHETIESMQPYFHRTGKALIRAGTPICRVCGCGLCDEEQSSFGFFCQEHGLERFDFELLISQQ